MLPDPPTLAENRCFRRCWHALLWLPWPRARSTKYTAKGSDFKTFSRLVQNLCEEHRPDCGSMRFAKGCGRVNSCLGGFLAGKSRVSDDPADDSREVGRGGRRERGGREERPRDGVPADRIGGSTIRPRLHAHSTRCPRRRAHGARGAQCCFSPRSCRRFNRIARRAALRVLPA